MNGGTLQYKGGGGITDTFTVPVLVQLGGTFSLLSSSDKTAGAKLIVQGVVPNEPNAASVYMTDPASSVQLAQQATLECDNDYYQAGGTLESTDTTKCTLQDGKNGTGTATIAGGWLVIASNSTTPSGELDVNCGTLNFAGTFVVGIEGDKTGMCDLLQVSGIMNIQAGSSLDAIVYGTQGAGTWLIINDMSGAVLNKFASNNDQQTGLHENPNLPNKGNYTLSF